LGGLVTGALKMGRPTHGGSRIALHVNFVAGALNSIKRHCAKGLSRDRTELTANVTLSHLALRGFVAGALKIRNGTFHTTFWVNLIAGALNYSKWLPMARHGVAIPF
jgi:hypothetical protein